MKRLFLAILLVLSLAVPCLADSNVTFVWDANSEADLKEYRLYQSDASGNYVLGVDVPVSIIPAGTETTSIDIGDGTWFWVLTAADNHGNESERSNEVTVTLDTTAPDSIKTLNITVVVKIVVK